MTIQFRDHMYERIQNGKCSDEGSILFSEMLTDFEHIGDHALNISNEMLKIAMLADDIVLLAKSDRTAKRLLETSTKYLEETLKLKVNQEKSRVVSVFAIRNVKYLGFTLGKNGKGIYARVPGKSWKKMKSKIE